MAGETTTVSAANVRQQMGNPGAGFFPLRFDLSYSTTQNELADVMQAGYLPPGVKVASVLAYSTDVDTGIVAVVHKVSVGSVDIVAGLVCGQAGVSEIKAVTAAYIQAAPVATEQLITVTTTTAAATAAAGTMTLILNCYNAKLTPA